MFWGGGIDFPQEWPVWGLGLIKQHSREFLRWVLPSQGPVPAGFEHTGLKNITENHRTESQTGLGCKGILNTPRASRMTENNIPNCVTP